MAADHAGAGHGAGSRAYNTRMKHVLSALCTAAFAALPLAGAMAQAPATTPATAPSSANARPDQTIERLRTEDAGAIIDEVRVGGQTQQIVVQPKANVPAYEVRPPEGARGAAPSSSSGDTNGSRAWNVLKF